MTTQPRTPDLGQLRRFIQNMQERTAALIECLDRGTELHPSALEAMRIAQEDDSLRIAEWFATESDRGKVGWLPVEHWHGVFQMRKAATPPTVDHRRFRWEAKNETAGDYVVECMVCQCKDPVAASQIECQLTCGPTVIFGSLRDLFDLIASGSPPAVRIPPGQTLAIEVDRDMTAIGLIVKEV